MDSVVFFISENLTQDDLGAWVPGTTKRRVFCRVSSIDDTEFHEAGRSGRVQRKGGCSAASAQ